MKVDPRFLAADGPEIFTGNELLLKGALEVEGGVHLLGGYPGSPIAGFFDSMRLIQELLNAKGVRAVINNNEALAAAMLNGSQVVGVRGLICMKSVGVHVAADALALGSQAGAHPEGGAVIVYGDDPWCDSTQVPSDSRYISKHLFIPVVEPADPQEIKDFVDLSFKLSAASELYVGFILSNNLADGGGTVRCRPNQFPVVNTHQRKTLDTAVIDTDKFVLLPPKTWWQEANMAPRFERAIAAARRLGLNRIEDAPAQRKAIGFVTSGLAHGYLRQALWEMGLLGEYPIAKFGMSYPLDGGMIAELAQMCERIIVVEERRGFMEEQIAQIVLTARQRSESWADVEVWGKQFPAGLEGFPSIRGLHPSMVIGRIAPLLKAIEGEGHKMTLPAGFVESLDRELRTIDTTAETEVAPLPSRIPSFCPGCPHRDSATVCLSMKKRFMDAEYMRRRHDREPVDLMFHGDTGCYTMLMYPPNTPLMHDYSGMGLGAGTGSGTDPFITNKQVVFMGDSTFFHSGQIAIGHAIKLGQDITFIILDNSTTAMTGHQPTPGVDWDIVGESTAVQDIEDIVAGIAGDNEVPVVRANPELRTSYEKLLEQTVLRDGVKVIIADKECGIMASRRRRREQRAIIREVGYLPADERMNINSEVCRFCLACAEMTGCPGLVHVQTDYGPKMDTSLTYCTADGACQRVGACWSFERVTIKRKRPARTRVPELGLDDIPEPRKRPAGELWYGYLAGVGGMGIGLATQILVRAGHKEGFITSFFDKKGLAIRNGSVNSQVAFMRTEHPASGMIPYGKADLLIGVDILEAARAMDPAGRMRIASPERTAAVVNTDKVATIAGVMGREDFDPEELVDIIRAGTRSDDFLARNISRICEKYLGSKIYANIMMLGFAFQKGLIPVSMHSIAWAIKDTIKADFKKNLYAFNMGRKLMEDPTLFQGPPRRTGWAETLDERCRFTRRRYRRGQRKAEALRRLGTETIERLGELDESVKRDVIVRLYDCMRWGHMGYAWRYARALTSAYAADSAAGGYAATTAAVYNLARAMLIKDAVFIAELATSPEKYARDREKYNVNPAYGDRIRYRHLLPIFIPLGSRRIKFELSVRPWMLHVLKRMKWLRKFAWSWHRKEHCFARQYRRRLRSFVAAPAGGEPYELAVTELSSARCIECLNPTCKETGCPLENRIPEWVDLAHQGRWRQACELLHETNNFPEFTASICPAPCQAACKQGLGTDYPVQIRSIEKQIVERGFAEGWIKPALSTQGHNHRKRVAVVGSGPAGLTVAQQLTRAGHDVVVFDKDDQIGGLLRWGVPEFRLTGETIDRRSAQLTAEGIQWRLGVEAGKDISGEQLREQFDAVCLATGASRPRDLRVPGREGTEIHFALDYLRRANTRAEDRAGLDAAGKSVVVIGGGETGNDCVETALMQGAKEVHQFEILPQGLTRNDPTHTPPAEVHRRWCTAAKAFDPNGSSLTVTAAEVHWVHSANGPRMVEVPGSDFSQSADMVLLALGFDATAPEPLAKQLGAATDDNGRLIVKDGATTAAGVFVAGDLATGAALVVNAIATGRKVAEQIDAYLKDL